MLLNSELLTAISDDPVEAFPELVSLLDPTGGESLLTEIDRVGDNLDDLSLRLLREHVLPVDASLRRRQSDLRGTMKRQAVQQRVATLARRLDPVIRAAARHDIARHLDALAGDLCALSDLPTWLRPLLAVTPAEGNWGAAADVAQVIVRSALVNRQLAETSEPGGERWITTEDANLTDRMHQFADGLTSNGTSVVIAREDLPELVRSVATIRVGLRSDASLTRAMTSERVALAIRDNIVVFSSEVRTSVVGESDGGHVRRRGTALDRATVVHALLTEVSESEILEAFRSQYRMTDNSINVLRADFRRRTRTGPRSPESSQGPGLPS